MTAKLSPADLAHRELEANNRESDKKRKALKPKIPEAMVRELLAKFYRLEAAKVQLLDSYDDNNFRVKTAQGEVFTLKIHNALDSANHALVVALNHVVMFVASKGFDVPTPVRARGGDFIPQDVLPTADGSESTLSIRLLKWVHGPTMMQGEVTPELMEKAGAYLARLQADLGSFYDKALLREHAWDLKHTGMVSGYVHHLDDAEKREVATSVIEAFRTTVMTTSAHFRHGVIHGDFNDANIVLTPDRQDVAGVIDFGDAAYSWLVNDVAIAMAYAMMSPLARKTGDPLAAAALLLRGFSSVKQLIPAESRHLRVLVASRLAASMCIGAYNCHLHPDNDYLRLHADPSWKALKLIWSDVPEEHTKALWEKAVMLVPGEIISKVGGSMWNGNKRRRLEPKPVTFVTGNSNKLKEVTKILGSSFAFPLENRKVDLPEIQGEPLEVAKKKCQLAAMEVKGPVMVEDTGLCFDAMGGLPGPYIKWFLDGVGHGGLNAMLEGSGNKSAYAQCVFAFSPGPGHEVQVFDGRTPGTIVPARGPNAFGWDPIFVPKGKDETYAEMAKEEKNKISHRGRALAMLKEYVAANADKILQQMHTEPGADALAPSSATKPSSPSAAGEEELAGNGAAAKGPVISFVWGARDASDSEAKMREMGGRLPAPLALTTLRLEGGEELIDMQGDPADAIAEKARIAARKVDGAVLVESFALGFEAMASLPGPYAQAFLEKIGPAGLQDMLSSFEDKSAVAEHRLAFCAGPGKEPKTFEGKVAGKVLGPSGPVSGDQVAAPGEQGVPGGSDEWQSIFVPDGAHETLASLRKGGSEVASFLPKMIAMNALEEFLRAEAESVVEQLRAKRSANGS